ncbi:Sec-independent protein translocase subunit TatA [Paenarthrobacter ilicis]|uniref:Sec-independent protein translocase protein TatA n=1 Tax=Paenarthrobacter ilicis TaxID=43665 RepID=A0ABX0THB0_9MICC|nr:Sec-independent protein translocase subunit TatA [Paenarthrobacter ilicis]MBM7793305.1 sec-independent protein translocase protein TatA [Paenarthrobacter ilicis]NIJ01919.1 sec-independent protein translocase protein TatA [Paenarthrobacter ilicis]
MGRLFDGPWPIVIIIIVALLLFAAPKLPGMARSLGQSMRIIKSEVKEMKNDGKPEAKDAGENSEAYEGRVVEHPDLKAKNKGETDVPPSTRL